MTINHPKMWRFLIPWKPVNQIAKSLVFCLICDVLKTHMKMSQLWFEYMRRKSPNKIPQWSWKGSRSSWGHPSLLNEETEAFQAISKQVSTELEAGPSSLNSQLRGHSKILEAHVQQGQQGGVLATHLSPEAPAIHTCNSSRTPGQGPSSHA